MTALLLRFEQGFASGAKVIAATPLAGGRSEAVGVTGVSSVVCSALDSGNFPLAKKSSASLTPKLPPGGNLAHHGR